MFGRIVSLLSEFELFSGEHRLLALSPVPKEARAAIKK